MRERTHVEEIGERLTEVRKGGADAEIDIPAHRCAHGEHRDVLARVIGARRRGIVPMIRGDDQQVGGRQARQKRREPRVESLEVRRVPRRIVAMSVLSVEVDEIGEDEPGLRRQQRSLDFVHPVVVARRVHGAGDTATGEEILYLADRVDGLPGILHAIQQGRREWRQGEVAPIGRPPEISRNAHERSRDDAADAQTDTCQLEGDLAISIELRYRDDSSCAAIWNTLSADV